jgi:cytochrome bd ubiquinol oxidase subunit I
MDSALAVHRLHFAFTITFHYLFPQLTMGLALLILILKTMALWTRDERYGNSARFWAKIFAVNFAFGVITGIPMEFQFGTNWANFSREAGAMIGQTLGIEGLFSFFLESSFLGLFLFAENRLTPLSHWGTAFLVFLGSWLSGYMIIATDAFMQHPTGYEIGPDGHVMLKSFSDLLFNPWAGWQYMHNMMASVVTASFVMAAIGAYYLLMKQHVQYGQVFLRVAVVTGVIANMMSIFPSGDQQGKNVALHQPQTLAAMEGLFDTEKGAPLVLIGQPDMAKMRLDNPIEVPRMLSFLTYQRWNVEVQGLRQFPQNLWPENIPLLYFSYHIMVGLGTLLLAIMGLSALMLLRGQLFTCRPLLWALMLALPFPYIATTAGWFTAELGRQPWLIFGVMRTAQGVSPNVSAGNGLFTLLGFMGLYGALSVLFLFLISREIYLGPERPEVPPATEI